MRSLFVKLNKKSKAENLEIDHRNSPKIYDPATAQIAALSVVRYINEIEELKARDDLSIYDKAEIVRLIRLKEIHAKKVKDEVKSIWSDHLNQPMFEKSANMDFLVHSIMLTGSACKQHIDSTKGLRLVELINEFVAKFWETKGIETFTGTCSYSPSLDVVYPKF